LAPFATDGRGSREGLEEPCRKNCNSHDFSKRCFKFSPLLRDVLAKAIYPGNEHVRPSACSSPHGVEGPDFEDSISLPGMLDCHRRLLNVYA